MGIDKVLENAGKYSKTRISVKAENFIVDMLKERRSTNPSI